MNFSTGPVQISMLYFPSGPLCSMLVHPVTFLATENTNLVATIENGNTRIKMFVKWC